MIKITAVTYIIRLNVFILMSSLKQQCVLLNVGFTKTLYFPGVLG